MFVRSKRWPLLQLEHIRASYEQKKIELLMAWWQYKLEFPFGMHAPPKTLKTWKRRRKQKGE